MHRVTIGDSVTLYNGDYRDIPTGYKIHHTITDPPYSQQVHVGMRSANSLDASLIDFESLSDDDFNSMVAKLLGQTSRWLIMTCDWRHAANALTAGLPLVRLGVWVKPNGAPQFSGDRPGTGWESVAIFHNPGRKTWNGGGHHAVWHCNIEQGEHPTQKPVKLFRQFVTQFTQPGEVIFDPFMGSGTTGLACIESGRKFIGCEADPKYFELACRRLENAVNHCPLFDPGRNVQRELI